MSGLRQGCPQPDDPPAATARPVIHPGRWFAGLAVGWTVIVVSLMIWAFVQSRREVIEAGRIQARTGIEKDVLYRRWNAQRGGLYAPADERTPPNSYLDHTERDVVTP